jgi:hypothetical protein
VTYLFGNFRTRAKKYRSRILIFGVGSEISASEWADTHQKKHSFEIRHIK